MTQRFKDSAHEQQTSFPFCGYPMHPNAVFSLDSECPESRAI
jgi:hypothetical protein